MNVVVMLCLAPNHPQEGVCKLHAVRCSDNELSTRIPPPKIRQEFDWILDVLNELPSYNDLQVLAHQMVAHRRTILSIYNCIRRSTQTVYGYLGRIIDPNDSFGHRSNPSMQPMPGVNLDERSLIITTNVQDYFAATH